MPAFENLRRDHEKSKRELQQMLRQEGTMNLDRLPEILQELQVHMEIEERILYAAAALKPDLRPLLENAKNEHTESKRVSSQLQYFDGMGQELCREYMQRVLDLLNHHVEEEEGEFFPKVEQAFSQEEIRQLTEEMEKIRNERLSRV